MSSQLYDRIGQGYVSRRRADHRIAAPVHAALGDARSVLNVGAGAGAYEPRDRSVLAVEPAAQMRAQRPPGAAACLDATAEDLPVPDASFDAVLAIYTDFHWADVPRGIAEMVRVSRDRVVLLTVDRAVAERYWLTRDYLPGADGLFGQLARVTAELPGAEIERVAIPHDCRDGFVHAWWRRPGELLRPEIRATMALFDRLPPATVQAGLARLGSDLDSGAWRRRNHDLLGLDSLDLGHRLVIRRRRPA
jgi:SAM-dependent methyltransferase